MKQYTLLRQRCRYVATGEHNRCEHRNTYKASHCCPVNRNKKGLNLNELLQCKCDQLSARSIAGIYKTRWQVELFFKWIKQNLKIKSFVGTSKNAVMTQIWIALCIYLLLAFTKFQSKLQKSTQLILRLLQLNLFEKRDLMALLRGNPPRDYQPDINQMALL